MAIPVYSQSQHQANLTKLTELQASVRPLAEQLLQLANDRGIPVRVASVYRSPDEQQALKDSGTGVTNAGALSSYHNYRLAFDVVPLAYLSYSDWNPKGDLWPQLGAIGKSIGLEWGGDWSKPDLPHFQFSGGTPISELKAYFKKFGEIMPITITPTQGGAIMAVLAILAFVWLYRDQL